MSYDEYDPQQREENQPEYRPGAHRVFRRDGFCTGHGISS